MRPPHKHPREGYKSDKLDDKGLIVHLQKISILPYIYLHTQKGEGTGISWGGGFYCFKRVGALEEFSSVREV